MSHPTYLYKILPSAPPDPLPQTLPATPLDTQDGFIHLSTAEQTPHTAGLFFTDHEKLWVLRLETAALDGRLEYLTDPLVGVHDGCAHLHESREGLGKGNVKATLVLERRQGEGWRQVEGWKQLEG